MRVGGEVWFIGGYPTTSGHVWVFELDTQTWRAGPPLPFILHHNIMSAFEHAGAVIVVGGMIHDGSAVDAPHHPHDGSLRIFPATGNTSWEVVPSTVPIGGITQCTVTSGLRGKRWCYTGSYEFHPAPFTFFEFDPDALRAHPLVPPPAEFDSTHVALFLDAAGGTVHMLVGRREGFVTMSTVLVYDLASGTWDLAAPSMVPYSALEARTPVQLPGARVALLLGGQNVRLDFVGDAVLQYDMRTRAWAHVDDLPQRLYGAVAIPISNGRVFVTGGGVAVGPKFTNRAYLWHAGELLVSPATSFSCAAPDDVHVIEARCGPFVVTEPLQTAVAAGRLAFMGAWCAEAEAVGAGEPDVPHTLAVTFARCGRERHIYCNGAIESCRLLL